MEKPVSALIDVQKDAITISFDGDIGLATGNDTLFAIRDQIEKGIQGNEGKSITFNMKGLNAVGSSFINDVLLRTAKLAQKNGGSIQVRDAETNVRDAITILRLNTALGLQEESEEDDDSTSS